MNSRPIKTTPTGEPVQKEEDDKKVRKDDFQAQKTVSENSNLNNSSSEIDSDSNCNRSK